MEIAGAHVILYKMVIAGVTKEGTENEIVHKLLAVLLSKRTQKAPTHPGYWGLFGGQVKAGEDQDPIATVRRELNEELKGAGSLKKLQEVCTVPIARNGRPLLIQYYSAPLEKDMDKLQVRRNKECNKVEGDGIAWFTAEEVHHLLVRPEDRIALTKFFQAQT